MVKKGTVCETGVPVTILLHFLLAATTPSTPPVPCEPQHRGDGYDFAFVK